MSPFWRVWFDGWCVAMILFALVVAGGALEATDTPFRILLTIVNHGGPVPITPVTRFVTGILGGVFCGWMVALWTTLRIAIAMGSTGRPLWIASTLGMAAWFVTDSTLSVLTGFALNVVPNTLALVAFSIGLFGSGALANRAR